MQLLGGEIRADRGMAAGNAAVIVVGVGRRDRLFKFLDRVNHRHSDAALAAELAALTLHPAFLVCAFDTGWQGNAANPYAAQRRPPLPILRDPGRTAPATSEPSSCRYSAFALRLYREALPEVGSALTQFKVDKPADESIGSLQVGHASARAARPLSIRITSGLGVVRAHTAVYPKSTRRSALASRV